MITYDSEALISCDGTGNMKLWNTSDCSLTYNYGRVHNNEIHALTITN